MAIGLVRQKKIRAYFAAEGFPKRITKKYVEEQGFATKEAFWEDANSKYEEALSDAKKESKKQGYEKRKEYNRDRQAKIREAKKRVEIDMTKVLKNDRYYDPQNPKWVGRSTQREINAKPKAFMKKMIDLQSDGRFTIHGTPAQMWEALMGLKGNYHVSYVSKAGLYRAGGFLRISKDEETLKDMKKSGYITLAQPKQKLSWPVKLSEVDAFYIKRIQPKIEIKQTDMKPTNFPVMVGDVVVYYAKDSWKQRRFKNSEKYKLMLEKAS